MILMSYAISGAFVVAAHRHRHGRGIMIWSSPLWKNRILLHEIVLINVRVRDNCLNQVLPQKKISRLQIIWNMGVFHLRGKSDDLQRKTIDILSDLSENSAHDLHEFFLSDLLFAPDAPNKSHGNEFGLAGFINIVKVSSFH